jgi:hypothetical protein
MPRSRLRHLLAPALIAVATLASTAQASVVFEGDIEVHERPPVVREEVVGVAPHPGWAWMPGYWYHHGGWQWHKGEWVEPPRAAAVWVPGHYREHPNGWTWVPGHWRG